MRWKFTWGMTLVSTSAMILLHVAGLDRLVGLDRVDHFGRHLLDQCVGRLGRRRATAGTPMRPATSTLPVSRHQWRSGSGTKCICFPFVSDLARSHDPLASKSRWRDGFPFNAPESKPVHAAASSSASVFSACLGLLRRVAVVDLAAAPHQVGVAHEAVLVERDVVEHARWRRADRGARVDDQMQAHGCCAVSPRRR